MPYMRLCAVAELPAEGEVKEFTIGENVYCVARIAGQYSALNNVCAHRGGPLGQGVVFGGKVICPWHGWSFDPRTGIANDDPRCRVAVYKLEIAGEEVRIDV